MKLSKILKIVLSIAVAAAIIIALLLTSKILKKGDNNTFTIGILQLADITALDDARQGFIDELKDLGVEANIDVKNAQRRYRKYIINRK